MASHDGQRDGEPRESGGGTNKEEKWCDRKKHSEIRERLLIHDRDEEKEFTTGEGWRGGGRRQRK